MMSTVATLVTNLIANTSKFSAPMKKAQKDVATLEQQFKKLQGSVLKIGLSFFTVEKSLSFLKSAFKDATTKGSELQKALGVHGVAAAEKLAEAVGKIKLALQQTVLELVSNFTPAIEKIVAILQPLLDRIGGGPQGALKHVLEQRKSENKAGPFNIEEKLASLLGQRAALQNELARLPTARLDKDRATGFQDSWLKFLFPGETVNAETANQIDMLRSNLESLNLEISSLEKNFGRVLFQERVFEFQRAFVNLGKAVAEKGMKFGRALEKGAETVQQVLAGKELVGFVRKLSSVGFSVIETVQKMAEDVRKFGHDRARDIRELVKTPEEKFSELFEEAKRLKAIGHNIDLKRLALQDPLLDRVKQLQSQEIKSPELAVKGSQEFLKAIHTDSKEEKKDIKQLVRIAQQELEQERRQAREIADEIARQRVTVNMP